MPGKVLNSEAYANAEVLYSSLKYSEALAAFTLLGNYRDSEERAAGLQEIVATLDREITLTETEIYLFPGQKVTLEPTITELTPDAPEETTIFAD